MKMRFASPDEPEGNPALPVIPVPRDGMSSDKLADYTGSFIAHAQARITGPGREQYDRGNGQRFERLTLAELLVEIKNETLDIPNYAAMFYIMVTRLEELLAEANKRIGEIAAD